MPPRRGRQKKTQVKVEVNVPSEEAVPEQEAQEDVDMRKLSADTEESPPPENSVWDPAYSGPLKNSPPQFAQISADEALKRAVEKGEAAFQTAAAIIEQAKNESTTPQLPIISYKNPAMLLNEKRKGLKFETLSETGDSHNKCWTLAVEVDGQVFEGVGRSKKMARSEASKYALIKLFNILCVPDLVNACLKNHKVLECADVGVIIESC